MIQLFFRYSLISLREHIKKRPPIATAEKVQQFVRVIVDLSSFYCKCRSHTGYVFLHDLFVSTSKKSPKLATRKLVPGVMN